MNTRALYPLPMRRSLRLSVVLLWLLAFGVFANAQAIEIDKDLPVYAPVPGAVSGDLKSIGSDTMSNMMAHWQESFQKFYPGVNLEVEGQGSATAPAGLISGTADLGPMSRAMKRSEKDEFEARYKYKPTELSVSIDMLAVYVHKDNPIKGLTLEQVDAIFSKTRRGGFERDIRTWGDAGLGGAWARQPLSVYGRNSASGTYGYFKTVALFKGDFKDSVKEQPGSSGVIQGVATDRRGIGYSGIGYKTPDVRIVPLSEDGDEFVTAAPEFAYSGDYPLARKLFLYINHKPNTKLDPLRREFIRYIFSRQGQADVVKAGYLPVTAKMAKKNLEKLGIPWPAPKTPKAR